MDYRRVKRIEESVQVRSCTLLQPFVPVLIVEADIKMN